MASILRCDDIQDSGGNSYLSSNGSGTFTSNVGITNAEQWGLDSDQAISSGNTDTLITGWSRRTNNGITNIGTIISESSGTFSFSATGKYLCTYYAYFVRTNHLIQYAGSKWKFTINNSTYNDVGQQFTNMQDTASAYGGTVSQALVDISDTTNCKIRPYVQCSDASAITVEGNNSKPVNYINFIRIGDT